MTEKQFRDVEMTRKDYDTIKDRMMDLVQNGMPDVAWTAAKTITDITIALEELKMRQENHAQQIRDAIRREREADECCSNPDIPAQEGVKYSPFANNELIKVLIRQLNPGEVVESLGKDSELYDAVDSAVKNKAASILHTKNPELIELAAVGDDYIALVSGGNNGVGNWGNYLSQLMHIIDELGERGYRAWLIRLENDCPDDVWYAYIGFEESV